MRSPSDNDDDRTKDGGPDLRETLQLHASASVTKPLCKLIIKCATELNVNNK